jgi:hypothetical protein
MTYAITSIPDDFADDSKSMFDRKYMTRLFETGFELGRSGQAWREKPSYEPTQPTTRPMATPHEPPPKPDARAPDEHVPATNRVSSDAISKPEARSSGPPLNDVAAKF